MSNAAFINAIAEEGTKEEAVKWLRRVGSDLQQCQSELEAERAKVRAHRAAMHQALEDLKEDGEHIIYWVANDLSQTLHNNTTTPTEADCPYCKNEREIETDNNGPIGPCPICRPERKTEAEIRADQIRKDADWLEERDMWASPAKVANELRRRVGE